MLGRNIHQVYSHERAVQIPLYLSTNIHFASNNYLENTSRRLIFMLRKIVTILFTKVAHMPRFGSI